MGEFTNLSVMKPKTINICHRYALEYDPFEGLADVFCPELIGYTEVKQGVLCMLVSPWDIGDRRERQHILLYGEPGCGKTVILEHLSRNYNALLMSMEPRASTLKGDARRKDRGAQIFTRFNGGIICTDDFELCKDMETFRDVMESGKYTLDKGGTHEEYEAQCRIVAAVNTMDTFSNATISRFDIVYHFERPTAEDAKAISRHVFAKSLDPDGMVTNRQFIRTYIDVASQWVPDIEGGDKIFSKLDNHFDTYGGETGRWQQSVRRLATSIAKLRLKDVGPDEIEIALEIKKRSDDIVQTYRTS